MLFIALSAERECNMYKELIVVHIPYSRFMNDRAKKRVDEYNADAKNHCLFLNVFSDCGNHDLEDILELGEYEFKSEDDELVNMMYELVNAASPVLFDLSDVELLPE